VTAGRSAAAGSNPGVSGGAGWLKAGAAELVVASNRGPFSLVASPDGSLTPRPGGGGLAPSLVAALAGIPATWVAAALSDADRQGAASGTIDSGHPGLSLRLVAPDHDVLAAAYDVVANAVLWFVYHGLFDASRRPIFDGEWLRAWEGFRVYNRAFADSVAEVAAHQQQRREHQRIGVDKPLQVLGGSRQLPAHGRERDVDDRVVHHGEQDAQA